MRLKAFHFFPLPIVLALAACDQPVEKTAKFSARVVETAPRLAAARYDAASLKLEAGAPDEALALLVSALLADPDHAGARAMAGRILGETRWTFPELSIDHRMPVDHVAFVPPSMLWVALSDGTAPEGFNTTLRWDLEKQEITGILFPVKGCETRTFLPAPGDRSFVIERGGTTLLCDARTLKPIREIGPLPEEFTPSAVISYTPDGLLLAHPGLSPEGAILWQIRDAASGQILRTSAPLAPDAPYPVAAQLDRQRLRILNEDGSLLEIPVSPLDPPISVPPPRDLRLLHAQLSEDGNSALALENLGPHREPELISLALGSPAADFASFTARFPWTRQPGLWSGLMRNAPDPLLAVDENLLKLRQTAPVRNDSPLGAAVVSGDMVIVGERSGMLTIHRLLPTPAAAENPVGEWNTAALGKLTRALAGVHFDEETLRFSSLPATKRIAALEECDFTALRGMFPDLDFTATADAIRASRHEVVPAEKLTPLWDRLARSDRTRASWDRLLALKNSTDSTAWEEERAKSLAAALVGEDPALIEICLADAVDLPPLLQRISQSRVAWLHGRKADALVGWTEKFPDLAEVQRREDWAGWEQADFVPALARVKLAVGEEIASIRLPSNSTAEQRKALLARLFDAETRITVGRDRLADACLKAALDFSAFADETQSTFQLASLARNLGAPPEPCLRAEALALTALGDFKEAQPRWITLITEHPVETHEPGDYAEAAYTSFENGDPRQAMEILATGLHRFPADAHFALRAGWVALLTGNADRAYRFLQIGERIGYPEDKLENAVALLAIAAAKSGSPDDAVAYFRKLLEIDGAWADSGTLDTLEWPEDLKSTLREIVW